MKQASLTRRANRREMQDRTGDLPRMKRTDLGIALFQCYALKGVEYTYDELAVWYGCTEAGVRHIAEKGLAKIRKAIGSEGMEELAFIFGRDTHPARKTRTISCH